MPCSTKQFRRSKSLLVFEMVRNNGLAGAQRIAGRRGQVGPDTCRADNTLFPAHAGANQKAVLGWHVFQDFTVFRAQSLGRHAGGMIEHAR